VRLSVVYQKVQRQRIIHHLLANLLNEAMGGVAILLGVAKFHGDVTLQLFKRWPFEQVSGYSRY